MQLLSGEALAERKPPRATIEEVPYVRHPFAHSNATSAGYYLLLKMAYLEGEEVQTHAGW